MDALLVSPASPILVTVSKALSGLIYGLLCLGIAFAICYIFIVQCWMAILVAICSSLFTISIGLLLGTFLENRQQLMIWSWVLIIPLVFPLVLTVMPELLPGKVIAVLRWIPSMVFSDMLRIAFSNQAPIGYYGPQLFSALIFTGLI